MTSHSSRLQKAQQATIQTSDHRFLVNEAGMLVYTASCEEDMEQFSRADAQKFQFAELLELSDYIQAHREEWAQAQTQLEQTWCSVTDELIDHMEAHKPGSAREATAQEIQTLLHTLGPITFYRALPSKSFAGRWYQSLWIPDEAETFMQQWVPFLRVFHQRRLERFPDLDDPVIPEENGEV